MNRASDIDGRERGGVGVSGASWAIVEIMGHKRYVALVSEVVRFGITMLHIEAVVGRDLNVRKVHLHPATSLFGLHPLTEEEARTEVAPPEWETHPQLLVAASKLVADEGYFHDDPIQRVERVAGWALFSGAKSEVPKFVAFFAGPNGKPMAECAATFSETGDEGQVPLVADPDISPAYLSASGGVYVVNSIDDADAIEVLADRFNLDKSEWIAGEDDDDPPDSVDPKDLPPEDEDR